MGYALTVGSRREGREIGWSETTEEAVVDGPEHYQEKGGIALSDCVKNLQRHSCVPSMDSLSVTVAWYPTSFYVFCS